MPEIKNNVLKGVLFSLLGTALFTPIFAAGKFAGGEVPAIVIVFIRYMSGFLTVLTVVLLSRMRVSSLKSPRPGLHFLRAILGIGGGAGAIQAAIYMPIADATAIGLTQGLMVVALAAIILRERVTPGHWFAGSLCALGAYVVISGSLSLDSLKFAPVEGIIAALAGALFIALEALTIKILARSENALGVLLYVNGFASLILLGPVFYMIQDAEIPAMVLAPFAILGPLAIVAQFCNIKAYRLADVVILGPVNYSWIIFATIIGVLVFDEIPDMRLFIGAALIVAGGIWLIRLSSRHNVISLKRENHKAALDCRPEF